MKTCRNLKQRTQAGLADSKTTFTMQRKHVIWRNFMRRELIFANDTSFWCMNQTLKFARFTIISYATTDCGASIVISCTRKIEVWNSFSTIAFEHVNKDIYDLNWWLIEIDVSILQLIRILNFKPSAYNVHFVNYSS